MASVFPDVRDAALAKLANALVDCIKSQTGTVPTAFNDRLGKLVGSGGSAEHAQAGYGRGVKINITINPDGLSGWAKLMAETPAGVQTLEGALDTTLLAAKLA